MQIKETKGSYLTSYSYFFTKLRDCTIVERTIDHNIFVFRSPEQLRITFWIRDFYSCIDFHRYFLALSNFFFSLIQDCWQALCSIFYKFRHFPGYLPTYLLLCIYDRKWEGEGRLGEKDSIYKPIKSTLFARSPHPATKYTFYLFNFLSTYLRKLLPISTFFVFSSRFLL